ncbi:major facilitator superfamily domain-containing protein [Whalleya microplaca]|nr:major facilitator superfamily domain-containing protein [Whalleya microplaca]
MPENIESGERQAASPGTIDVTGEALPPVPGPSKSKTPQFWITIVGLSLLAFVSALDVMIITTALPTIVKRYRRIHAVSLFSGAAYNATMIIAGRTVQGVGAGGIYVLIDIVCCDLVPLRDRGTYLAIVNSWAGIAAALGPVLGGALGERHWRWIFYMNLPICALPLATISLFMNAKTGNGAPSLRNLDYLGNFIFIPSMIAILFGLIAGGSEYPWASWHIIVPLTLGAVGWIGFHIQQHFFASNPSVPTRLFSNRTSAIGYALTFLGSLLLQEAGLFLPVYFQAVLDTTVFDSGIYFLPLAIGTLFSAAIAGILLSKFGVYRPLHAATFGLSTLAYGLFTLLDRDTPKVAGAFFELIIAGGLGMTISVILPAILAALPESDVASGTAAFSFIKTFGFVWGVTIPSIIFNAVFNTNLSLISSSDLRKQLENGQAYSFASRVHNVSAMVDQNVWDEVVQVYITSLRAIWWFGLGVSSVAFLLVGGERGLELSTELKTEYGLEDMSRVSNTQ